VYPYIQFPVTKRGQAVYSSQSVLVCMEADV